MITINTAFSTCPNDTFIFHAMVHGKVHTQQFLFKQFMADVEELNNDAFLGTFELTKLSFHAYFHVKNRYVLLNSGSALGHGCGPLLVAKHKNTNISTGVIAVPGMYTTALLLLKLWNPDARVAALRFNEIMPAVRDGKYAAGLIIHEGRFVFESYGLEKIIDLGEWWEEKTNFPIPLGCIALRKDKEEYLPAIDNIMRASIEYALTHPDESRDFIRKAAQEMHDTVIQHHIELYVNEYTRSMGEVGKAAIATLETMARKVGIL